MLQVTHCIEHDVSKFNELLDTDLWEDDRSEVLFIARRLNKIKVQYHASNPYHKTAHKAPKGSLGRKRKQNLLPISLYLELFQI